MLIFMVSGDTNLCASNVLVCIDSVRLSGWLVEVIRRFSARFMRPQRGFASLLSLGCVSINLQAFFVDVR